MAVTYEELLSIHRKQVTLTNLQRLAQSTPSSSSSIPLLLPTNEKNNQEDISRMITKCDQFNNTHLNQEVVLQTRHRFMSYTCIHNNDKFMKIKNYVDNLSYSFDYKNNINTHGLTHGTDERSCTKEAPKNTIKAITSRIKNAFASQFPSKKNNSMIQQSDHHATTDHHTTQISPSSQVTGIKPPYQPSSLLTTSKLTSVNLDHTSTNLISTELLHSKVIPTVNSNIKSHSSSPSPSSSSLHHNHPSHSTTHSSLALDQLENVNNQHDDSCSLSTQFHPMSFDPPNSHVDIFNTLCLHADTRIRLLVMVRALLKIRQQLRFAKQLIKRASTDYFCSQVEWSRQNQHLDRSQQSRQPEPPAILTAPPYQPYSPLILMGPNACGKYLCCTLISSFVHFRIVDINWNSIISYPVKKKHVLHLLSHRASSLLLGDDDQYTPPMQVYAAKLVFAFQELVIGAKRRNIDDEQKDQPIMIVLRDLPQLFDAINHRGLLDKLLLFLDQILLHASADVLTMFILNDSNNYHVRILKKKVKEIRNKTHMASNHYEQSYLNQKNMLISEFNSKYREDDILLLTTRIQKLQSVKIRPIASSMTHMDSELHFKPASLLERQAYIMSNFCLVTSDNLSCHHPSHHHYQQQDSCSNNSTHGGHTLVSSNNKHLNSTSKTHTYWTIPWVARQYIPYNLLTIKPSESAIQNSHHGNVAQMFIQIYMHELHARHCSQSSLSTTSSLIPSWLDGWDEHKQIAHTKVIPQPWKSQFTLKNNNHHHGSDSHNSSNNDKYGVNSPQLLSTFAQDKPNTLVLTANASYTRKPIVDVFGACEFIMHDSWMMDKTTQLSFIERCCFIERLIAKYQLYHQLQYNLIHHIAWATPRLLHTDHRFKMIQYVMDTSCRINNWESQLYKSNALSKDTIDQFNEYQETIMAMMAMLIRSSNYGLSQNSSMMAPLLLSSISNSTLSTTHHHHHDGSLPTSSTLSTTPHHHDASLPTTISTSSTTIFQNNHQGWNDGLRLSKYPFDDLSITSDSRSQTFPDIGWVAANKYDIRPKKLILEDEVTCDPLQLAKQIRRGRGVDSLFEMKLEMTMSSMKQKNTFLFEGPWTSIPDDIKN